MKSNFQLFGMKLQVSGSDKAAALVQDALYPSEQPTLPQGHWWGCWALFKVYISRQQGELLQHKAKMSHFFTENQNNAHLSINSPHSIHLINTFIRFYVAEEQLSREKSIGETPNQAFGCLAIGLNMDNLHPLGAANGKQYKTAAPTHWSALTRCHFNGQAKHYYNVSIFIKMWN